MVVVFYFCEDKARLRDQTLRQLWDNVEEDNETNKNINGLISSVKFRMAVVNINHLLYKFDFCSIVDCILLFFIFILFDI